MKILEFKCNHEIEQLLANVSDLNFTWNYEGDRSEFKGVQIAVYSENTGLVWESDVYMELITSLKYEGEPLLASAYYQVKIKVFKENSDITEQTFGFVTAPDYPNHIHAKWIWLDNQYVRPYEVESYYTGYSSPQFLKRINLEKEIKHATAYVSALGAYEIHMNDQRIDDSYFNPGWTDYRQRLTYQAYDVKELLTKGENTIKASLADGWYRGFIIFHDRNYGDLPLKLFFELHIEYTDGEKIVVASDESWKAGTGSIVYSDYQLGERYEPVEVEDDEYYNFPVCAEYDEKLNNTLVPQLGPMIKVHDVLDTTEVTWLNDKTVVLNVGQNISGFLECVFEGLSKEQCIQLEYGEMLNDDNSVYVENLRLARQKDYYVALGKDGETYKPHFTSHGFQYVQITGISKEIFERSSFKAIALGAGCKRTGTYACGDEKVNKLYSNLYWGQVDNFSAIPTDCPQRNERLGWTGDAQIFCATACYNMDCHTYYQKYCLDMSDSQFQNGSIGDVVPLLYGHDGIVYFENGNGAWADAVIIIPWKLYLFYGDTKFLKSYYVPMKRYADFLIDNAVNYVYKRADYGDWLSVNEETPKELVAAAYATYDMLLLSKIAKIIGNNKDAIYYEEQYKLFKEAFNNEYVNDDYTVLGDTQTDYLLMLSFNLAVDNNAEKEFAKHLVRKIRTNNNHLSSGFVGISYLMPVLCSYGFSEVAYDLLLNTSYPSWLYSVVNGATTIWERWNSYTLDGGFGDVSMNSFNHYSLGSIGEWMFSGCGGIMPDQEVPGFKKIHIKPFTDKRLGHCDVTYQSNAGLIESHWKYVDNKIQYRFKVPVGVEAYIYIKDAISVEGASFCRKEENMDVYLATNCDVAIISEYSALA